MLLLYKVQTMVVNVSRGIETGFKKKYFCYYNNIIIVIGDKLILTADIKHRV